MKAQADTLTNVLAAAAIGVLQLGVAISLAALIFSGPLAAGAGRAAAGFVLGTAIVSLIVGATSKMSIVIAGAQDTAAIMVAAGATAIVASPGLANDQMLPTVVVMIALAGVLTGLVFWALGHYGLSSFVRFLPFPVISGFTAGTGWLLFRGGIEVMHRGEISVSELGDLFRWQQGKFLLPGLILAAAILMVVTTSRLPNTLVSVAILGSTLLFHLIGRSVSNFDQLEANGWFIGPFAEGAGWAPLSGSDLANTNWTVLLNNGLLIAAVVAVSVIGLLLNLTGLEGGPDAKIDLNTEIRSAGIANVLAGLGSGLIGYHLLGDIVLGRQIGARGKSVPITIAGIALATFLIGPSLIALVPRATAGGVLAGLGVTLLVSWIRTSLPRMNRPDQSLSALILVVIAVFGVLAGVGAGVVVAAIVFIVKYSRIDPVRHVIQAAGRSTIDRDQRDQATLAAHPESILVFELQGYLFFGSTTGVQRQVETMVDGTTTQFVIVDFARVTGIDSTAATGLKTLARQLGGQDVAILWSGVASAIEKELTRDDLDMTANHHDLDHAIAWCEDQVIAETSGVESFMFDGQALDPFNEAIMEVLKLPRLSVDAGDTLISSGATDSDVYFVEAGTLTAWIPTEGGRLIRMRQVLPGAALGEVSFCTGAPRSATVIADTAAVVRILTRKRFDEIAETNPPAAIAVQEELLRRLGTRLSSTSAMVRDLLQ